MIYNIVDIEEAKEKIKPELFNHPQFMKEWKDAYDYMSERSGKSNITIKVSEDGKGISIQEQYVAKGINPEIKNNSELSNTTVILDDNGGLILEKSNGLCIEVKDYIDITCKKLIIVSILSEKKK